MRVKICGINDTASLAAATEAGADWVGFVFYPPSPRAVTPEQAAAIAASVEHAPLSVGLFVEPDDAAIEAALTALSLDILQIHAEPDRVADIRQRFGRPVWRAVGVETAGDLPADDTADGFLLDAKPQAGETRPGGNARIFDWSILQGWSSKRPWLLAGGLTPDNVAAAILTSGAQAIDVSSGVERARGKKDPALIKAFVTQARSAASGTRASAGSR